MRKAVVVFTTCAAIGAPVASADVEILVKAVVLYGRLHVSALPAGNLLTRRISGNRVHPRHARNALTASRPTMASAPLVRWYNLTGLPVYL